LFHLKFLKEIHAGEAISWHREYKEKQKHKHKNNVAGRGEGGCKRKKGMHLLQADGGLPHP